MPADMWLAAAMFLILAGVPALSFGFVYWSIIRNGSSDGRPEDVDPSAPERTIPGGRDR